MVMANATLITAAQKWRGIPMTPKILRTLDTLRAVPPVTGKEQAVA